MCEAVGMVEGQDRVHTVTVSRRLASQPLRKGLVKLRVETRVMFATIFVATNRMRLPQDQ